MNYHEFLSTVEALAVIAASTTAIVGINSWRKEAKWKRKAEVAEEVLLSFYKVRSVFEVIRHPLVGMEEISQDRTDELRSSAAVTTKRYQENMVAFDQLRSLRWKYRVVFPRADEEPFEEVEVLLRKILASSYMLGAVVWPRQGTNLPEPEFQKHLKEMHDLESWHWRLDDENDPFKPRFEKALKQVEVACSKYMT